MESKREDIGPLSSVRRMELKSKAVFCGGFYEESGPVLLGGSASAPDPHFNRISVLDAEKLDRSLLCEAVGRLPEGTPAFIDVPHPAPEGVRRLLREHGWQETGESRSSMLLTGVDTDNRPPADLDISCVAPDTLDVFLELFLKGFATPQHLIPLAKGLFHDLVLQNCHAGNSRLYLGAHRGEPAVTLYLFYEGDEGGVNMVATKEELRGRGLATAMMRRAMADARELGIKLLSLETRWAGAPERLYRRLGFTTLCRHEVFSNAPDMKYGL